jgi:hypothetical protein
VSGVLSVAYATHENKNLAARESNNVRRCGICLQRKRLATRRHGTLVQPIMGSACCTVSARHGRTKGSSKLLRPWLRPRAGIASLGRLMAIWRGTSARLRRSENVSSGHRDAGQTRTTVLSIAAHIGQAKVRKSKPGLSGSRRERIIGASQSAQNGRSLVALPWKNEGMERLSITLPLVGRERNTLSHR